MKGYVCIHRDIWSHWIAKNPRRFQWWIYLISFAAWESHWEDDIFIERGQLSTSIRTLAGHWQCNNETALEFLRKLERNGMIIRKASTTDTLITIVNYDKYQSPEEKPERKSKRKSKPIIEIKKEINQEMKNNIISLTREQDLKFFDELKSDEIFKEEMAMTLHCSLDEIISKLEQFKQEMLVVEKYHPNYSDYRKHFFNWVRLQLNKRGGAKNTIVNGKQASQDKYQARRGTDAGSHTEDDYSESFTF